MSRADRAEPAASTVRDDVDLVADYLRSSDQAAFAELVRRYRDPVFRLAVSVLGQEFVADAEDVAQDALVRVHHSLRSFRGDAKFGTWVYRIAFNVALNAKSRMRYRAPHESDDALASMASADRGPDAQLLDQRRLRDVRACLQELPEVYQSALRLHYWLGASVLEIADLLDAPENTVKSYLHRGRLLLGARLRERGIDA